MAIITDFLNKYKQGGVHIKFILVNLLVFVAVTMVSVLFRLFNLSISEAEHLLFLPASVKIFITQPWSIITFMFMHRAVLHILFNMMCLYFFGELFLRVYSSKHLRGLYFLGGICGGLFYMLAYNLFPIFEMSVDGTFLSGASASVLAIMVAIAYRMPEMKIRLFLFGNVSLKYVAVAIIILDLLQATSANSGGHISHIGGELSGLLFGYFLNKGRDLTAWINLCIDLPMIVCTRCKKKEPKFNVRPGGRTDDYTYNRERRKREERIDKILEKIKENGYANLTEEEKQELFNASSRNK